MSWKPDLRTCVVDAMTVNWKDIYLCAFPPFRMILKMLQNIEWDKGKGILWLYLTGPLKERGERTTKDETGSWNFCPGEIQTVWSSRRHLKHYYACFGGWYQKQYVSYIKKRNTFGKGKNTEIYSPTVLNFSEFLTVTQ